MKQVILLFSAASLLLLAFYFLKKTAGFGYQKGLVKVSLGGKELSLEFAQTPDEHERGLSGRSAIGSDGMLFEISPRRSTSFWMKDMLIPLDIIWLDGGRIVGIEAEVSPPAVQENTTLLKTYSSPQVVEFVLEMAAGRAKQLGLKIGDRIEFLDTPK